MNQQDQVFPNLGHSVSLDFVGSEAFKKVSLDLFISSLSNLLKQEPFNLVALNHYQQ